MRFHGARGTFPFSIENPVSESKWNLPLPRLSAKKSGLKALAIIL
jgi:hypothetical protein